MTRHEYGGLTCRVVDAPSSVDPSLAVVLCHGYGAPADDLVPIGAELLATDLAVARNTRLYFPAAPLDLEPIGLPEGRAWWPIDMLRLVTAVETGDTGTLRTEAPAGLAESREKLLACLAEICRETGLPLSRIVLGGFSQGAMLATDVALRLPEPVAALYVASGSLIAEPEWRPLAERARPLRVLIGHGRQDPILPFAGSVALRDLLAETGHAVEFFPFDGGHTIGWPLLHAFSQLLAELASAPADGNDGRSTRGDVG
jgi:phospholipase/carboxylesterase